jgi:hypothetical protein
MANDKEEFGPNEDINIEMDVREDDKPLETDDTSLDDEVGIVYKPDNEGADDEPYTESDDEPAEQHDKSVHVPHIDDTASKDPENGGTYKEPTEGVDDANRHDENYAPEHISRSTHQDNKMTLMTAQDDRDKDTVTMLHMKPVSSAITLPRVHTTTPLEKDVHQKEMMVAQLNLLQQQAVMDKKQIREELFDLKSRIRWLEDRAMERQDEPTEPSSSQRHQRVLLLPPRQDHNNIMIPSLHPVLSQQDG